MPNMQHTHKVLTSISHLQLAVSLNQTLYIPLYIFPVFTLVRNYTANTELHLRSKKIKRHPVK